MSMTSSIPVLQGKEGTELRSEGDELVLRRPHEELDIPLAAIRWVHAEGRVVAVELTAPAGVESALHRIEGVSRAAARAFADAVNVALPERAGDDEGIDGSTLVTTRSLPSPDEAGEEEEEAGEDPVRTRVKGTKLIISVAHVAHVAFSVIVGIAGEHVGRAVAVLLTGALGIKVISWVASALWAAWDNWYLPRHGITVDASRVWPVDASRVWPDDASRVWLDNTVRYAYTDTGGTTHSFFSSSEKETIRIAYDPSRPSSMVGCGGGWGRQASDLLGPTIGLVFAAPFVYGAIALALPAFDG
ncbi:hypothetical protein [Streptomyces sp. NPDC048603]|uniref:hypothetical protein n=1 Tax=Streptomyces sp. NPDC048603 TaxID=3365577 RepID=UPI003717B4A2